MHISDVSQERQEAVFHLLQVYYLLLTIKISGLQNSDKSIFATIVAIAAPPESAVQRVLHDSGKHVGQNLY